MAAKHATHCAICGETLGHLWMGRRHRIPDYTCPTCFKEWECDESGNIISHSEQPAWLKYLKNAEAYRRQKRRYWQDRGYDIDMITFSDTFNDRNSEGARDDILAEVLINAYGGRKIT